MGSTTENDGFYSTFGSETASFLGADFGRRRVEPLTWSYGQHVEELEKKEVDDDVGSSNYRKSTYAVKIVLTRRAFFNNRWFLFDFWQRNGKFSRSRLRKTLSRTTDVVLWPT